jgi:sugar phosphate permease
MQYAILGLVKEMTMADKTPPITTPAAKSQIPVSLSTTTLLSEQKQHEVQTRAFVIAWFFTVIFYFLEYAVRSSPSVMIPELEASFHTTALGIGTILGIYYYTYPL